MTATDPQIWPPNLFIFPPKLRKKLEPSKKSSYDKSMFRKNWHLSSVLIVLLVFLMIFTPEVSFAVVETVVTTVVKTLLFFVLQLAAGFLGVAGYLLDYSIKFTLDIADYTKSGNGIEVAWRAVRDLLNLSLIFILLWIAIKTIIGQDDFKKHIPGLIIFGVLVNFSLVFTRFLIDLTNVIAYQFYAPIAASASDSWTPIASSIMNSLKLQSIFTGDFTKAAVSVIENSIPGMIFGIIFICAVAYSFFQASIYMIIRSVMLIVLMMFSPLMVAGHFFSGSVEILNSYIKKWWSNFICWACFAPIYLLFLWLIIYLLNQNFINTGDATFGNFFEAFFGSQGFKNNAAASSMIVLINMAVVLAMLNMAIKTAKQGSCEGAEGLVNFASSKFKAVGGLAGGAALGAAAFLGRTTLSRAGQLLQSETAKELANKGGFRGAINRTQLLLGDKMSKGTWDVRNAGFGIGAGVANLAKEAGLNLGKGSEIKGFEGQREVLGNFWKNYEKKTVELTRSKETVDREPILKEKERKYIAGGEAYEELLKKEKERVVDEYMVRRKIKKADSEEGQAEQRRKLEEELAGEIDERHKKNVAAKIRIETNEEVAKRESAARSKTNTRRVGQQSDATGQARVVPAISGVAGAFSWQAGFDASEKAAKDTRKDYEKRMALEDNLRKAKEDKDRLFDNNRRIINQGVITNTQGQVIMTGTPGEKFKDYDEAKNFLNTKLDENQEDYDKGKIDKDIYEKDKKKYEHQLRRFEGNRQAIENLEKQLADLDKK